MAEIAEPANTRLVERAPHWLDLFRKEDWWAIWIGLGLISVSAVLFASGSSIKWLPWRRKNGATSPTWVPSGSSTACATRGSWCSGL